MTLLYEMQVGYNVTVKSEYVNTLLYVNVLLKLHESDPLLEILGQTSAASCNENYVVMTSRIDVFICVSLYSHLQLLDELPMIYSTCVFVYCL